MDLSPEYVKMCEKAAEIQELSLSSSPDNACPNCGNYAGRNFYANNDAVWLPRQDQLQGMVRRVDIDFDGVCFDDGELNVFAAQKTYSGDTFEQVWLKFVMSIKYKKVWNGQDWEEMK